MDETVTLVIKYNNTPSNDPCALCGLRTDSSVGPELFAEGTWALVCDDCGARYAPELLAVLSRYYSSYGDREEHD
jgi:hypothetical protein